MTWLPWLQDNWFTALQTLALLASFSFTTISLRRDERSRRVENIFRLTAHHRDLWSQVFQEPQLRRVFSPTPDLVATPVTEDEVLFVSFLVLHLNTAFQAIEKKLMDAPEGLGADIRTFFSHPIPRAVWDQLRPLQDTAFIDFVESHF